MPDPAPAVDSCAAIRVVQCTGVTTAGSGHDEDWDAVAALPDALPGAWRRQARREHLELLGRWLGRPTGRWLKTDLFEEGSASRALIPSLRSAWWVGVDVSPTVAGLARRATPAAVVADVRRLPFRDGAFDGVLSTSTFDHFDDVAQIRRAVAEAARVTVTGGSLVLTLDNLANPLIALRNVLPRSVAARTGLVPFAVGATLDLAGAAAVVANAGFDVASSEHLLHAPHIIGTRLARFRWWERLALPVFPALARTRVARRTGHYVAVLGRRRGPS